ALTYELVRVILAHELAVGLFQIRIGNTWLNPQGLIGKAQLICCRARTITALPRTTSALLTEGILGANHAQQLFEDKGGKTQPLGYPFEHLSLSVIQRTIGHGQMNQIGNQYLG